MRNIIIISTLLSIGLIMLVFVAMGSSVYGDYVMQSLVSKSDSEKWIVTINPNNESLLRIEGIGEGSLDGYSWKRTLNGTGMGNYDPKANRLVLDGYYLEREIDKRITETEHRVTLEGRLVEGNLFCNMTTFITSINDAKVPPPAPPDKPFTEKMEFIGQQKKATISGHVFNDTNSNGRREAAEPGLSEWTVNLKGFSEDGAVVALNNSTNFTGYYEFGSVSPGNYQINEVKKYDPMSFKRWNQTLPRNQGSYNTTVKDSDIPNIDFGNHLTSILELYSDLDLNGANFHLAWLNGLYANLRVKKFDYMGGSRKIKPIGYVDGKPIKIDTYDDAIACGSYQGAILEWLDDIRSNSRFKYLLEKLDYGPIVINKFVHYAVVLYPEGTDWRQTGIVLDPWYCQRATLYTMEEYKKWLTHATIEPDNGNYAGKYPLTGGKGYSYSYPSVAKPKELDLSNKVQVLVHCPVDVLVTDDHNNILGATQDGDFVENIPSAFALTHLEEDGTLFWYFVLPDENRYQAEITGKENGLFNLQMRHGMDSPQDYGNQSISKGEVMHLKINPNSFNAPLVMANRMAYPTAVEGGIPA